MALVLIVNEFIGGPLLAKIQSTARQSTHFWHFDKENSKG
jgi:hypothetical protein